MSGANLQSLAAFAGILFFLLFRFIRFKRVSKALPDLFRNGAILVDVRSAQEFAVGHNPNSINAPLSELEKTSRDWDRSKTIVLCCASGTRSGMAARVLKRLGFLRVLNAGSWTNTLH